MAVTNFSIFKYKHGQRTTATPAQAIWAAGLLLAGVGLMLKVPILGIVLIIVAAVVFFSSSDSKGLMIGPRYLICGASILYYRNLARIELQSTGTLDLLDQSGNQLRIEKAKFPTGARKTDKIERNTAAKFSKAAGKIIQKVAAIAPDVEILEDGQRRPTGVAR